MTVVMVVLVEVVVVVVVLVVLLIRNNTSIVKTTLQRCYNVLLNDNKGFDFIRELKKYR